MLNWGEDGRDGFAGGLLADGPAGRGRGGVGGCGMVNGGGVVRAGRTAVAGNRTF